MAIQTLTGVIQPLDDGVMLVHEHLYFDMSKAIDDPAASTRDVGIASTALTSAARKGLRLVVENSTVDMGRNVWALREISLRSGVHVVASTGRHRQLTMPSSPGSIDAVVEWMVRELTVGIEGSDMRAGSIGEIGTDGERFTDAEYANFIAAASAQAATGAPLITHTPSGRFGVDQAQLLIGHGADPSKICVGHLGTIPDMDYYLRLADLGVWMAIDQPGIGLWVPDSFRAKIVGELLKRGCNDRLLISGDVAFVSQMQSPLGFTYCFTEFWQRVAGVGDPTLFHDIFCANPNRFLSWPAPDGN